MLGRTEAEKLLKAHGQAHVLCGFDGLAKEQQEGLLKQVEELDFDELALAGQEEHAVHGELSPMGAVSIADIEKRRSELEAAGRKVLAEGKVAALLLAGGMGTRLGSDRPKGELNVGETRTLYLFECLINNLQAVVKECGTTIPLYIMTSEKNDADTRAFFKEHDFFGYPETAVHFFVQQMAAAVDYDGKLLMEGPGRLATSPNGNGGWFSSLKRAGYLEEIHRVGIEWINIFAVDNPLQKICDPVFVGATVLSGAESGSKVIRKNSPDEKLGVLCHDDGRPSIIEYYDMTQEMQTLKNPDGSLAYAFGVILNYLFRVDALERIVDRKLPVHVVEKKIPYMDERGQLVKPEKENGYKFETLVVDMIRMMNDTLAFEVVREKEFAPIKNLHGRDSLDSSRELMKKNGIRL